MSTPSRPGRPALDLPSGRDLIAGVVREESGRASEMHAHAEGQLLGSEKGLVSIGTARGVSVVPAVHAVWFPPHCPHFARSHGAFDGWVVYVAEAACATLPSHPCTIRTSALLREAVSRAGHWPPGALDGRNERIAGLILDEIGSLPIQSFDLPLPGDTRLLRVARALIDDPADARDLASWAAWTGVSPRTLSRRFVSETGFSFTAWRQRARLMRSLEMLADGLPVTAIAIDLGYATASAFINLFKRMFNETPATYRRKLSSIEGL